MIARALGQATGSFRMYCMEFLCVIKIDEQLFLLHCGNYYKCPANVHMTFSKLQKCLKIMVRALPCFLESQYAPSLLNDNMIFRSPMYGYHIELTSKSKTFRF